MNKLKAVFVCVLLVLSAALAMTFSPFEGIGRSFEDVFELMPDIPAGGTPETTEVPAAPEPTPLPTPTPTPSPTPASVKMAVTGDLMVHSWQLNFAFDAANGIYDFSPSLADISPYISKADLAIGNLETTFAGKEAVYSDYPLFNTPDTFGAALRGAGFGLLTTANNHCNDRHEAGILRTIETLDALGLEHTGTFASEEERENILIKEVNGISFAIISYSYGTNGLPLASGKPWLANIFDDGEQLVSDIKRARALEPDFVVVFPHMGNEYETYTRDVFKDWVKLMLRAGADIVLASHPHVIQPVEFYSVENEDGSFRDCFAAYSLGNFISSQRTPPRDAGLIMYLDFEKEEGRKAELKEVSFVPTWVKFRNASGQYDIRVLPLYDAVKGLEDGSDTDYPSGDVARIKNISAETTKILLGEAVNNEDIRPEYTLEKENVTVLYLE